MIDEQVFSTAMALIGDRTPNRPNTATLGVYYAFLSPRLTNEEFQAAAMAVFAESEFFPAPIRFLEVRSTREWPRVMELLQEFTPPNVPADWSDEWAMLSEEARGAVIQFGGPLAFKGQLDRDVMRTRSAFIESYQQVARDTVVEAAVAQKIERPDEPSLLEAPST